MEEYLKKLPKEIKDLIHIAGDIAFKLNMPAYLVGGFVRDLLLGVKNLDLDIVVEGDGIKFAEELGLRLPEVKLIRHKRFWTATLIVNPHLKIDITTARCELYPAPAHLPEVSPGSLRDDLYRRDFTINAMAISITGTDFGRLIDFFAGKSDLRCKKVRVLHNLSFIDDPTRILRAIRFEKRYNFKIEAKTLLLLKEAVKLKMLKLVQPQRLRDELILILKEKQPLKCIRRIDKLLSFNFINPHLFGSRDVYNLLNSVERQIFWFKKSYPKRRLLDSWLIYFMALMDHLSLSEIKSVCRKFVFTRGEEKRILTYKKVAARVILNLRKSQIKPSKIFTLLEPLSYEVILLIKAKSSRQSGIPQDAGKNRNVKKYIEDFFEIYNGMRIYSAGDDLHKLGISPGPHYQKIFTKVLKAKLNGQIKTKEEELTLIKKWSYPNVKTGKN